MRKFATACALASLTLLAGCGSDSTSATASGNSSGAASPASSAAATGSAAGSAASSGAAGSATVLTGTVGTKDDPNAFSITLTDASGQKVTSLPAGKYTIQVHDLSSKHNFHLTGGSVDQKTSVPDIVDTTFDVTLTPGTYTFKCDPHPPMTGTFTVN